MSTPTQRMAQTYLGRRPERAALLLEQLDPAEIAAVLQEAPAKTATVIVERLAPVTAGACMEHLPRRLRSAVIEAMSTSIATALLRRLTVSTRTETLDDTQPAMRSRLERALGFPSESAGELADPHALTLEADWTVDQALTSLRNDERAVLSSVFVLDRGHRLLGSVSPSDLLNSQANVLVGELKELNPPAAVFAAVSAATLIGPDHRVDPIAVVDRHGTFLGVITDETLRRLARDRTGPMAVNPVAALGELYWLGMRELFGGLSSGPRLTQVQGEPHRADND